MPLLRKMQSKCQQRMLINPYSYISSKGLISIMSGSSGKGSDKFSIEQKKTAEHFIYLNNHKQIYNNEQQFSISCMGALQP